MTETDPAKSPAKDEKDASPRPSLWKRRRFTILFSLGLAAVIVGALWSQAGDFFNNMQAAKARTALEEGRYEDALEQVNAAIADQDDQATFYELRARIHLALSEQPGRDTKADLQRSLADWDRLLDDNTSYRRGYLMRAEVRQRLGRHQEAIADANLAAEWGRENSPDADNAGAYFRARANLEIPKAVALAERAVSLFDIPKLQSDDEYQRQNGETAAQFLDTRGYSYYRAGRTAEALADLELAVKLFEAHRERTLKAAADESEAVRRQTQLDLDHNLAVILHHRGLARGAQGQAEAAAADVKRAAELGYNEEQGVF